jgi:aminoglycoside phosphotransferase (APT) family kinase protein
VTRHGDEVHRPAGLNAAAIHELLRLVRDRGFDGAPRPLALAGGQERLEYIPGDVPVAPFPRWWKTDRALASTAALLRRFHDVSADLNLGPARQWSTELMDPRGSEVICHNDVCPENVVYRDERAVALLDFDFAAPGRRVYDLAQLTKLCCPLDAPGSGLRTGLDDLDPFARLRVAADAYGRLSGRAELVDAITDAVEVGDQFVKRHVAQGEPSFVAMWEASGGEQRLQRRVRWLADNRQRLLEAAG